MTQGQSVLSPDGEIKISFGYQCNGQNGTTYRGFKGCEIHCGSKLPRASSFSCLSGAALSANATLANTNIYNGLIGEEILPSVDSPYSFRKVPSSPRLDILSSSLQSSLSNLSCSPPSPAESDSYLSNSMSPSNSFSDAIELQVAGGAAGEDRVQAVCSEENGWLFCAIYDGFNGRDAADFLAGTLYETIISHLNLLDWEKKQDGVLNSLQSALNQTENEFLCMVEREMKVRPDLVSIGSCVLVMLLHGKDLYMLNLGDSRVVLATYGEGDDASGKDRLEAVQLTDSHTCDDEVERARLLSEHPDDSTCIIAGKIKGRLKVTRAFGVGYLKKKKLNDALMGILRVSNLISPPYVSIEPSMKSHRISKSDHFVIAGSDGLFDFFTNEEAVDLVHSYICNNPSGDPAKFLVRQLLIKAAKAAGFSKEELMNIPAGRRRKYHDDVTVIVLILGTNQRTSKASTCA